MIARPGRDHHIPSDLAHPTDCHSPKPVVRNEPGQPYHVDGRLRLHGPAATVHVDLSCQVRSIADATPKDDGVIWPCLWIGSVKGVGHALQPEGEAG